MSFIVVRAFRQARQFQELSWDCVVGSGVRTHSRDAPLAQSISVRVMIARADAIPVAVAFDVITFPVQLYVYTHWNDERTRW